MENHSDSSMPLFASSETSSRSHGGVHPDPDVPRPKRPDDPLSVSTEPPSTVFQAWLAIALLVAIGFLLTAFGVMNYDKPVTRIIAYVLLAMWVATAAWLLGWHLALGTIRIYGLRINLRAFGAAAVFILVLIFCGIVHLW